MAMSILFITSSRLGDAVIASGAIDHIRRAWPEAKLTVACGAAASGVFARLPGLERLIVFEKKRREGKEKEKEEEKKKREGRGRKEKKGGEREGKGGKRRRR